jgi:hypothetical protein
VGFPFYKSQNPFKEEVSMRRRIYTAVYSRNSVLELREGRKIKQSGEWKEIEGRLVVRAATLQSQPREIIMSLSPAECFRLATTIKHVVKNGGRKTAIVHRPQQDEAKFSEIIVERWENNGRSGYAIILQIRMDNRIAERINIPTEKLELVALAKFLEDLNTLLRWREVVKVEQEQEEAPEDDIVIDDEDIDL